MRSRSAARRQSSAAQMRSAARSTAAINGLGAVEKMKPRARLTRCSVIARGPHSSAPSAPRALPPVRSVMT